MISRPGRATPLVSVVIPAFDVEAYLAECLDSILAETALGLEVIVIDDGSHDGTARLARDYARHDRRVRVLRQRNRGLNRTRNRGLRRARGRYVWLVDADDVVAPGALAFLARTLEQTGSDFAVGRYERWGVGITPTTPQWMAEAHERTRLRVPPEDVAAISNNVIAPSKMFRVEFLRRHGLAFEDGMGYEDQQFAALAFVRAERIDVLDAVVYRWRVRSDSSSLMTASGENGHIASRLDAMHAAVVIYRAKPALEAKRLRALLDILPRIAERTLDESPRVRADVSAAAARLLDDAELPWADATMRSRIRTHLLGAGDWEALARFEELARGVRGPLPLTPAGSILELDPGFQASFADRLPDRVRRTSPERLTLRATVDAVADDPEAIRISGWMYLPGVEASGARAVVTLLAPDGERVSVPTRWLPDPEVEARLGHALVDYGRIRFEVDVPLADLGVRSTTWTAWGELRFDGFTASASLNAARVRRTLRDAASSRVAVRESRLVITLGGD